MDSPGTRMDRSEAELMRLRARVSDLEQQLQRLEAERQPSALLQTALDEASDAVLLCRANAVWSDAEIVYVNPAFERMTGYTADELIGRTPRILQGPNSVQPSLRQLDDALRDGRSISGWSTAYRKDGSEFDLEWHVTPTDGRSGHSRYWLALQRDLGRRWQCVTRRESLDVKDRAWHQRLTTLLDVCNNLCTADSVDALCRQAVELGRSRLGIDRMSIWLLDTTDPDYLIGTFGTDEAGNTRDERGQRVAIGAVVRELLEQGGPVPTIRLESSTLCNDCGEVIGHGTSVWTTIGSGKTPFGFLCADNLLTGMAIDEEVSQILLLYASALERLCASKRAEDALRDRQAREQQTREQLAAMLEVATELVKAENVEELCRSIVTLGRDRLGFERLSVWFLDTKTSPHIVGTYGIDEQGKLRDERHSRLPISQFTYELILGAPPIAVQRCEDVDLSDEQNNTVGHGTAVWVPIRDTHRPIGMLYVDTLLTGAPIDDHQCEILAMYGTMIAHLCSLKQAEDALRGGEEKERKFRERLMTLLQVSNEICHAESLDDLCRLAVGLGRTRLGFDRLGIHFLDAQREALCGSYGTDEQGRLRNEYQCRHPVDETTRRILNDNDSTFVYWHDDRELTNDRMEVVGRGEQAWAPLWDGRDIIGFLSTDDLLRGEGINESDRRLLALYASTLGHLCSRHRAAEALQQSEERYRRVVEALPMTMYTVNARGPRFVLIDGDVERMTGYPPEAFYPDYDLGRRVVHPDDREWVTAGFNAGLESHKPFELEYRMQRPDGQTIWVQTRVVPVYGETGHLEYHHGIANDVTKRRDAEEELKRSQAFLHQTLDALTSSIAILDANGTIAAVNESWSRLVNAPNDPQQATVGQPYLDLARTRLGVGPDDIARLQIELDRLRSGQENEYVLECSCEPATGGGQQRWFVLRATSFTHAEKPWIVVAHHDATDRYHAIAALRESQARYRHVMDTIPVVIFSVEAGTNQYLLIDGAVHEILGCAPDVFYEDYAFGARRVHPDDQDHFATAYEQGLKSGRSFEIEFRYSRPDNQRLTWLQMRVVPVLDKNGTLIRQDGVCTDITQRKEAEEALRLSEEGLAEAQRIAHLGNFDWDCATDQIIWSDEVYRIFGVDPATFTPTYESALAIVHPQDRDKLVALEQVVLQNKRLTSTVEYRIVLADGSIRHLLEHGEVSYEESGRPRRVVGTIQDITMRKRMEEALRYRVECDAILTHLSTELLRVGIQGLDVELDRALATIGNFTGAARVFTLLLGDDPSRISDVHEWTEPHVVPCFKPLVGHASEQLGTIIDEIARGQTVRIDAARAAGVFAHVGDGQTRELVVVPMRYGDRLIGLVGLEGEDVATALPEEGVSLLRMVGEVFTSALQRCRAEQALRESERRFRSLFEETREAMYVARIDGTLIDANPAATKLFGFYKNDVIGQNVRTCYVHPEDRERLTHMLETHGAVYDFELELLKKDGTPMDCTISASLQRDSRGEILGYQGIVRDITKRKRAEEALRQSEALYRAMFEENRAIKILVDPNTLCLVDANRAACEFYGLPIDMLGRLTLTEITAGPEDQLRQAVDRCMRGEQATLELRQRLASDEMRDVEVYVGPIDVRERKLLFCIIHDVTERKRAERQLRDSEALLNKTGSMANIGGWQLDLRTNQLRWTRQVYEIHELDPSYTPTVEAAVRFYTLEAIPILQEALDRAATRGEPFDLVLPFITAKGDERWVRAMGEPAREGDDVVALIGTFQDITERKRAMDALRESEQRFRLLAESIEDVFWLSAPELDPFLYVSPAIEKIWKRAPQQLYADARLYTDAIHPEDRPAVLAGIKDDADQAWAFEYRIVQPDGAIRWIYDRSYPIRDEAGTLIRRCGVATDITEQKQRERERERYEEQLRHVRKMEAVGTLASGIAHDFNNLLTAIFGYAGVARRNLSRGHPALFAIDMIEQAGRQASGVTNSLLTFSRKSTASKTPIDLGATIGDALRLLRHALPASIDLVQDMPEPRQIWIRGDATQMQQIMMNLAVNARDAMPDGGELRVSLRTQPHADAANTNESATMPNAVLTVEDSGVGMPEDIRARVFEPFFTTKSRGQGTGLGMSVIHGIITDHGGSVEVESAPGRGSRFIITLPCCPAPSSMVSPTLQAARTRGDGQLVLLVEDNVHVRAIMTSTLRSAGYRVDQAADGFEALDRFEKHPAAFNVVVVDADLPKKSGLACLHEMRGRRPDLPGVLITGGAGADETSRDDEPLTLLRKPFQMTDLLCVIEDLLVAAKEPGGGT